MSKGLEALNKIRFLIDFIQRNDEKTAYYLNTIEAELKRLEQIDNSHLVAIPRRSGKSSLTEEVLWYRYIAEEQDKVLQIIKDQVNIEVREIQGTYYLMVGGSMKSAKPISKETYDLLKEYFND